MSNKLWMVVGPSGTGKTTLVKKLVKDGYVVEATSHTSRAPRAGEVDGMDYHYVSREEFTRMLAAGEFLEDVEYNGNLYGVARAEIDTKLAQSDVVIIVEGHGAEQLKTIYGDRARVIFMRPPSLIDLSDRLLRRGDKPDVVATRLQSVEAEMAFEHLADVVLDQGTPEFVYSRAFAAIMLGIAYYPETQREPLGFWDVLRENLAYHAPWSSLVRWLLGGHWECWGIDAPLGGPVWVRAVRCYRETGLQPGLLLVNLQECEHYDHARHQRQGHRSG